MTAMKAPTTAAAVSLALLLTLWRVDAAAHPYVPAIYVFGDSLVDVGNNNFLRGAPPEVKANYPHNGIDYPGGKPTGRFSNGYNGVDFLAKMMGFRESPPPVLSIRNSSRELIRGVSYASGGSGILDSTRPNISLPMNTQIRYFRRSTRWLAAAKGKTEAQRFLSKSIFVFSTANNDMFAFFSASGPQISSAQKDEFVSLLTTQYTEQLKKVYSLGARKFVLFGTSQVGCPPALRAVHPTGGCMEDLNDLSRRFNKAMEEELHHLSLTLKGFKYSFFSTYDFFTTVVANARKFGFKEANSACCGSGPFNGVSLCLSNVTVCTNRNEYLSWDRVHPTQAMYKLTATFAYKGDSNFVTPVNVWKLASY